MVANPPPGAPVEKFGYHLEDHLLPRHGVMRVSIPITLLALGAASAAMGFGARSTSSMSVNVPRGNSRVVSCSAGSAWVTVDATRPWRPGEYPSSAFRAILVEVLADGTTRESRLGNGIVVAFSRDAEGDLWAVRMVDPSLPTERTVVLRSTDGGTRWEDLPAPPDVVGVAFESLRSGYAWSYSRVYRTEDGGGTWLHIDLSPMTLARGNASGRPVLGSGGVLWVPAVEPRPGARPVAKLTRVSRDLSHSVFATWSDEAIAGVALSGGTRLLILLTNARAGASRLVAAANGTGGGAEPVQPWSDAGATARDLSVCGDDVLMYLVKEQQSKSPLSSWPTSVARSRDNGKTWNTLDVTGDQVTSVCAAPAGMWTSSSARHRVSFVPHE